MQSRFFIIIFAFSLITVPFHLLGLKGLIGVIANFLESKLKIGPCTERLYAVLPAGEEIKTPSEISFLLITFFPHLINN